MKKHNRYPTAAGKVAAFAVVSALLAACGSQEHPAASRAQAVVSGNLSCTSGGSAGSTSTEDNDPGALIIDLGSTPQTQGNALKPYGLVYDLVKNLQVPVLWAYNTSKSLNSDVDFSVDGKAFRGSSFIIPAGFVATAQATVNKWAAQGVLVYGPTQANFSPPTYFKRLTGFPNIVLDPQNGAIAQGYLTAAGFPLFPVQFPATLNSCQDLFVLPHADPTWANHGNLKPFVSAGGFLWVGCHAVSVLEALDGNADGVPDMDFLSTTGLINYANHSGGFPPYNYSPTSLADPVMQFLGSVDSALSGGSEQVYLPFLGGAWRPTTKVSIWDPDQVDVVAGKSPGLAVKVAYGRGYGLPGAGIVMYEGSHNFAGTSADQIAAQRAFLNFILWNASEKSVVVKVSVPSKLLGATTVNLTSTATSSGTISSYQWTSSCGGSFGTPTAANTTFTPPAAAIQNTPCVIRLTASDSCSRQAFDAQDTTILGQPDLAVTITPSTTTPTVGSALDYTVVANNVGGLPTVNSIVTFTLPPASQYTVASVTPSPTGIVCTARVAPNTNIYDCPVGDLDGCSPVTILVKGAATTSGCFTAGVSGTTTSADVDLGSNTAAAQTCSPVSGDHPVLSKTVSPASPSTVNPGGTLTYTLTLSNGGTTQLDNIHIYDPFPTASTTYVASSSTLTYQQYTSTIADSFAANTYTGSTGQLPWSGPWTEISDGSGRASNGNLRVKANNCASTSCPNLTAKVDGAGIQRSLSLLGASAATLGFSYRVPTNKAGQNALVQVSTDGTVWRTMTTLSLATKISVSTPVSVAFSAAELTANTRIRFVTTGTANALFVPDDISILLQTAGRTISSAGSTPAAGNSYDLTENLAGLLTLKPGASITATFRTTVNAAVAGGTAIANTANVKTSQTGATATNSNTATVFTAAVGSKAPVAATQTLILAEDAVGTALAISAPSDADTAQGSLSVLVKQLPSAAQATIYLADGVTPLSIGQTLSIAQLTALKISGSADFNGVSDPFVYVVTDPQGNSSTGSLSATFSAVNDAPIGFPDSDVTQKGVAVELDAPGANDTDVDGEIDDALCDLDPATVGVQSSFTNSAGTWVVDTNAASASYGSVTYTPVAGFSGVAALSYASNDNGTPLPAKASAAGSNCQTNPTGACLTVRVNAPPVAVADSFSVTPLGGNKDVASNDSDADGLLDVTSIDLDGASTGIQTTFTVAGKGTFSSLLTGQVRFVPVQGFVGSTSTSYTIDDFDGGTSASVLISVTVTGCTSAAQCDDGNACTSDVCVSGACSNPNLAPGTSCNDQNSGTKNDVCGAAAVCGGTPYTCSPTACESASTPNGSGCVGTPLANGTACNDSNACTQADTCQSGVCTGANPVICAAADQCHTAGSCDAATGVCTSPNKANGAVCNDGNACTQSDTCQGGTCTGANPITCAAADQCHTAGSCDAGTGVCTSPNKADGAGCNDGNACTQSDTCQAGTCSGANPITCAVADQCHTAGSCVPATGVCAFPAKANDAGCDDGNACTQSDTCQGGTCTGANPVVCTAADACHLAGSCSPATGSCSSPKKADGSTCSDGDGCTQTDTCQSGTCTGSNPVQCTAFDQCHAVGTCAPATGTCSSPVKPEGSTCSDGNGCTQGDQCQGGVCSAGGPVVCASPDKPTCAAPSGVCGCNANADCLASAPVCDVLSHTCFGCLADQDCASTQFCNTETRACTGKLPNGLPVPTIGGHSPALTGACNAPVGSAVCTSKVCDTADQFCGYPNGSGPCTASDGATLCRSAVCDAKDSKCGYADGDGPCTADNAALLCRSGACSVSGVCQAPSACSVDGDCIVASQFCNTESHLCAPRLPNGTLLPTLTGHDPLLTGACSVAVGSAVCTSNVCDSSDDHCGYANGSGTCLASTAQDLCRSGACDASDQKCGYADGDGPCTAEDATLVCRSGACSVSGVCQSPGKCSVDGDCASTQFCDSQSHLCSPKLANLEPIPSIPGHTPALTGECSEPSGSAVCSSAVCDESDDACGYANGTGPCQVSTEAVVCRSTVCDEHDNKCGYANGDGPCTGFNAAKNCRSGACSTSGVCQPAGGCTVDGDCTTTQFCNSESKLCAPKLANGAEVPVLAGHSPPLTGDCDALVGAAVCSSAVCDAADDQCGYANGNGQCTSDDAATVCRSAACASADGKCGYANGEGPCASGDTCRSGSCSVSGLCQAPGTCTVDGDCSAVQFCNTQSRQCTAKLGNGTAVPTIADHSPALTGTCSEPVSAAVCKSAVCDVEDNACGYLNGHGPCMVVSEAIACRSAVCDATDAKCGYADGHGPCTAQNAATTCRSGSCSESGLCQTAAVCRMDRDCSATQFCDTERQECTAKLANGTELPTIAGHAPPLTGNCNPAVGGAVCSSAVCDPAQNQCGFSNGHGPCTVSNQDMVCQSSICDADDEKCGHPDGKGPCTLANAGSNCRSGACSASVGLCKPQAGCVVDADCASAEFCNSESAACTPKLPNARHIPTLSGHTPPLTGVCSQPVAAAVCVSATCDPSDDLCGLPDGAGPCTRGTAAICRSGSCTDGVCGKPEPADGGVDAGQPSDDRALLGGGCACTFAGAESGAMPAWSVLLLGVGLGVWRRRRSTRSLAGSASERASER